MNGCQFVVSMWKAPTTMTNSTTATFKMTIAALKRALSRMPMTRMTVMARTTRSAGRFITEPVAIHAPSWGSKSKGDCVQRGDRTTSKMPRKDTK